MGIVDRKIQTTGHMVEWLLTVTPDSQLQDPRLVNAVRFLLSSMYNERTHDWKVGPKGHALRSLAMYYERVYQPGPGMADAPGWRRVKRISGDRLHELISRRGFDPMRLCEPSSFGYNNVDGRKASLTLARLSMATQRLTKHNAAIVAAAVSLLKERNADALLILLDGSTDWKRIVEMTGATDKPVIVAVDSPDDLEGAAEVGLKPLALNKEKSPSAGASTTCPARGGRR